MIVVGLTGSIGMGKSYAASILKKMGIPVHDSDRAVHQSLLPNGEAFEEVAVTFPACWDKKTLTIDRKKLGHIVFNDGIALKQLEQILHPVAKKSQMAFIKKVKAKGKNICVLEIPLLFETKAQDRVDYVVCVSASPAIQRRRVLARKGMTIEKFEQILSRQMPDAQKRARSDFVVNTGLGAAQTYKELKKIVFKIKHKEI